MTSVNNCCGAILNAGWGRLIFAHTFPDASSVASTLLDEVPDKRDIAFYVNDPHLILNQAPQDLFLDPSNTYRLNLEKWERHESGDLPFRIVPVETQEDVVEVNRIYASQNMVPIDIGYVWDDRENPRYDYFVAKAIDDGRILGVTLGVDHTRCFDDIFNSCSLWALAVDPQAMQPGVGVALVRHLADHFSARGRSLLDLSVMYDNTVAISLYESLGFEKVAVLAIKRRNQINEKLFIPHHSQAGYNPYAALLINEALRRGIAVAPLDPQRGYFRLTLGNRRITCRESLTDLTSAIAMSRCADKQLTRELLDAAGLSTPDQIVYQDNQSTFDFLSAHGSVVVKPVEGEQGHGVAVNLHTRDDVLRAIEVARQFDDRVLIEQYVAGEDLRIVVINFEVVAAAIRKPAEIIGNGKHTVRELIERVSRRRSAATGGESQIPIDDETLRCVAERGYSFDSVINENESLQVRKAANLHTGGTIHDVTDQLHPALAKAAIAAARALEIPVVGLDFIVPSVQNDEYVVIEANERPGLANHEPQPTAERFIDLLFPHTAKPVNSTERS